MKGSESYRERISPDEFSNAIRLQAGMELRRFFRREPESESDPMIELIGCLLEDGAGGVLTPPEATVTTEQWLTWNHLALNGPQALTRTITRELKRERTPIPVEQAAMKTWAARLLLATLNRLGML